MTDTRDMDPRNLLLLATLSRAKDPLDSEELLAAAIELALDHMWTTDNLTGLNRKGVAKRCRDLVTEGLVLQNGVGHDGSSRRTTPRYVLADAAGVSTPVPAPPVTAQAEAKESPYEAMDRTQLIAVLDAHDDIAACLGRFLSDLTVVRERARRRLVAAGLGER